MPAIVTAGLTDDDTILLCAFRYCLGRRSYIVEDCVRWIRERWEKLSPPARKLMMEELGEAIEKDRWYRENYPTANSAQLGSVMEAFHWQSLYGFMEQQQ